MILVSCRKNFDSNQFFAETNQIRRYVSLQNLEQFDTLSAGELAAEVAGKHVLVLVHGFRNPLPNVARSYADVEAGLARNGLAGGGAYGAVIGFGWPGFQTAAGFFPAVPSANRSASHLRGLLRILGANATTVDVETHSLGARVGLQAIAFAGEVWVDNLLLTAPAVDDESLEPKQEFNGSLASCRRCLVYHSAGDPVLQLAYRVGDLDRALGYKGPQHRAIIERQCKDVFVVDCSNVVHSHGGYRHSDRFYEHWARVLHEDPLQQYEALPAEVSGVGAVEPAIT
jgi:esterase/lipase superfamily enzyme